MRTSAILASALALALAALLAAPVLGAAPARAQPLEAGSACGGDAYSHAEVTEGRGRPRRGPLVAVPDTLCADLAPQGPPTAVEIAPVVPLVAPQAGPLDGRLDTPSGYGGVGRGAPYGGEGPRRP